MSYKKIYLLDMYMYSRYIMYMIKTFKCKETEQIYNQHFSKKLPSAIQKIALRKLIMMDNAASIQDLKVPPSNHLEKLSGNRAGQYSIRINDQYIICFTMDNNDMHNIEIVDYHE